MIGWQEIAIIGGVALLLFGPKKLPELARSLGSAINEFRSTMSAPGTADSAESKQIPEPKVQENSNENKPVG
jgi:TatA/E family protein of Tat protein translocase